MFASIAVPGGSLSLIPHQEGLSFIHSRCYTVQYRSKCLITRSPTSTSISRASPSTKRPTLFSLFYLFPSCVASCRVVSCLPHYLPQWRAAATCQYKPGKTTTVLLPSLAAQLTFRIWHALARIWDCRAPCGPCLCQLIPQIPSSLGPIGPIFFTRLSSRSTQ